MTPARTPAADIADRLHDAALAIALYGDTPDLLNAARDEIKRLREAAGRVCEAHAKQRALWNAVEDGIKSDDVVEALFASAAETGELIDELRAALSGVTP